jgi:hypothetical protein
MDFKRFAKSPSKRRALTKAELTALRTIASCRIVDKPETEALERLGLIEFRAGQWTVTQDGAIQLAVSAAR